MGILGLSKLISEKAPSAIRSGQELKAYSGRRVAIDASMSIYQCLIALKGFEDGQNVELMNANGKVTSHLNGIFARTLKMVELGIKPIYVFDGKPPELKKNTLDSRKKKSLEAASELEKAAEIGDNEAMTKMSKRVRVTSEQNEEVKRMLTLMGIPVVQAPSEAEAQCAEIVRANKAWAVATDDMDALTFGSNVVLRHFSSKNPKSKDKTSKGDVVEIKMEDVLKGLDLSMDQFIDLCILLGCDYLPKIQGIGPHKAWESIVKYGSIEKIVESLDTTKHHIPDEFLSYPLAREIFKHPEVLPGESIDINFNAPDEEGLKKFMVEENLFRLDRVENGIAKLKKAFTAKVQVSLETFFTVTRTIPSSSLSVGAKRKREEASKISGSISKSGGSYKKAIKK